MNKINYQRVLEQTLEQIQVQTEQTGDAPTLLLHSCCAPCSSYVLEYLSQYFCITVFYYNPNIYPEEEYRMRVREQQEFIRRFPAKYPISFLEGDYDTARFYEIAKGLEQLPEGGGRCFRCYELRLREAGELAREKGFDYFTTTLSISPLKNAEKLNEIGQPSGQNWESPTCVLILRRKTGTNVPQSSQKNMACTGRTTAAAYIHTGSGMAGARMMVTVRSLLWHCIGGGRI